MSSTWGGATIPAPTRYSRNTVIIGSQYVLADGALQLDRIATKTQIDLEFAGISDSERSTLATKFTTFASAALVIENEASENVIPVAGSLRITRTPGASQIYTVSGQVRTV